MKRIIALFSCILWLEANAATPSYSNFSSNQFAPSGTYTVTVKDKPLLTNIVEHAQLSLTNPAFANSLVYITNMRSLTGLTNTMEFVSTYGPQTQFAWTTNGIGLTNTVMVISNGMVGIGVKPTVQLEVANSIKAGGDVSAISAVTANLNVACGTAQFFNFAGSSRAYSPVNGVWRFTTSTQTGAALLLPTVTADYSAQEGVTNTLFYSEGTNVVFSDILQSPGLNITTNLPPPAAASRIGGMYLWNSNSTHLYLLVSSPTSAAWTSTNKLFGP